MAVGAFATYKLAVAFPWLNIVAVFLLAGVITALVGLVFGFPSLRIKGFYLAVATLALQFFLILMFNKFRENCEARVATPRDEPFMRKLRSEKNTSELHSDNDIL